jgi:hypothetical protein
MAVFTLELGAESFPVSRKDLLNNSNFFEFDSDRYAQQSYRVAADVALAIFQQFLTILRTGKLVAVTAANAGPLSKLAAEFGVPDLLAHCRVLLFPEALDRLEAEFRQFRTSTELRLRELESTSSNPQIPLDLPKPIAPPDLPKPIASPDVPKTVISPEISETIAPPEKAPASKGGEDDHTWNDREFPFEQGKERNGILFYLHQQKQVEIRGSSKGKGPPVTVLCEANPSGQYFCSDKQPNQSIVFEFAGDRVVQVKHYAIKTNPPGFIKSWVLEGSEDGQEWTKIHEGSTNEQKKFMSFPVNCPDWFGLIRVRQTAKNFVKNDCLILSLFEIFGTLGEP